jgi:isopenicillin N synthase-like dioxygenase
LLFRIFHYPPTPPASDGGENWGVGEHSDYGLLTLLAQDDHGGLQVKTPGGWIAAPPIPGTLVCNIGDMLDRLTGGWYLSTPHRVRNDSGEERLSFPLFFDPDFAAEMVPLPAEAAKGKGTSVPRWDNADLQAVKGTYGDYLLGKVSGERRRGRAMAQYDVRRRDRGGPRGRRRPQGVARLRLILIRQQGFPCES